MRPTTRTGSPPRAPARRPVREPSPALAGSHLEEPPRVRHALERVDPAILEQEPRPRDEVADDARRPHLAVAREGGHPSADVDRDALDAMAAQLDLAGVHAGANLDAERADRDLDRKRAADGPSGTVEARQEPVAGGVDLLAS